jgi:hypothetical protein
VFGARSPRVIDGAEVSEAGARERAAGGPEGVMSYRLPWVMAAGRGHVLPFTFDVEAGDATAMACGEPMWFFQNQGPENLLEAAAGSCLARPSVSLFEI